MQAHKMTENIVDILNNYKDYYRNLSKTKLLDLNNPEDWKYNKLNFIKKNKFSVDADILDNIEEILDTERLNIKLEQYLLEDCYNIAFISGKSYLVQNNKFTKYNSELIDKVSIESVHQYFLSGNNNYINNYQEESVDNYFQALNNGNYINGFYISILENIKLERPINIIFINNFKTNNYISNLKNYIKLNKNTKAEIFLNYLDFDKDSQYFLNNNTEIFLDDEANLNLHKLQNQNLSSYNVSYFNINQNNKSKFSFYNFAYGSLFSKDLIRVNLNEEYSNASLYGIISSKDKQYIDVNTKVYHNAKNCSSFENYKGLADNNSTAVFNGSIIVKAGASNTDAQMSNKNLLLSDIANIYTKPELKIYNDDVKCSHGTTIGSLDSHALFYLQSRGLSYIEARKILINAFLGEILEKDKSLINSYKQFVLNNLD